MSMCENTQLSTRILLKFYRYLDELKLANKFVMSPDKRVYYGTLPKFKNGTVCIKNGHIWFPWTMKDFRGVKISRHRYFVLNGNGIRGGSI